MKKMICVIILLFSINANSYSQEKQRYIDSLFVAVQTNTNLVYTSAPQLTSPYSSESSTVNVDLTMHVFQPQGDTLQQKPMLVCLHGGGFVSGTKEHDDMMTFCRIFAAKGYVTATAQYRLGMNLLSNTSGERAVYRAIQDIRALLRYLRQNASTYKISPDHIYLLGSSAGSFMALHNLFMDKESERPAGSHQISGFSTDAGPDLGTLDAIGSYFSLNSKANGIVALWGAVQNTTLIEASDSQIPVFLVHGTADNIVPFGLGSPFQASTLSPTYGSQLIDQRLTNLSYPHETYFVQGEGHEFYGVVNGNWNPAPNQYWYIVIDKVRDFLFDIHKPTAAFNQTVSGAQVTFANQSTSSIAWFWDFGDGSTSTVQNPSHTYAQSGNYAVTLTAHSQVHSTNTVSKVINVTVVGVSSIPTLLSPANGSTNIAVNPTLSWNAATGATSYRVQVSTSSNFTTTVADQSNITTTTFNLSGLSNNEKYYWRVNSTNVSGTSDWSTIWSFTTINVTAVEKETLPEEFMLSQNYPNPFNPTTIIQYQLSSVSNVTLRIFDILGREVTTLVNERQNAGRYAVVFDGARYPSGVYFYRIDAAGNNNKKFMSIKKLVLLK